jgi:hypothetical protein
MLRESLDGAAWFAGAAWDSVKTLPVGVRRKA